MSRFETLKNFLKESPDDPFLHFALAKEYEKQGKIDDALNEYQYLVQNHSDYVGTYYHLGKLLETKQVWDRAQQIYQQGIDEAKKLRDNHAARELREALTILRLSLD